MKRNIKLKITVTSEAKIGKGKREHRGLGIYPMFSFYYGQMLTSYKAE